MDDVNYQDTQLKVVEREEGSLITKDALFVTRPITGRTHLAYLYINEEGNRTLLHIAIDAGFNIAASTQTESIVIGER